MKCPYCDSEIENNIPICPHCMASLSNVKVVQVNTNGINNETNINNPEVVMEEKKKSFTKYYIIIVVMVILLVILLSLVIMKMKPEKNSGSGGVDTPTTTGVIEKDMTLNKGIFSGKENPLSFGNMTIASIHDVDTNTTKFVDVMVTRYLSDAEVSEILANNNQTLNEGFTFVGVEYNVDFHDLSYLGTKTLSPILDVAILESKFFNNYFLVNGHYYKSDVISSYNGPNIRNEESATVRIVYQVPVDQKYYICFGSDSSSLGCFSG